MYPVTPGSWPAAVCVLELREELICPLLKETGDQQVCLCEHIDGVHSLYYTAFSVWFYHICWIWTSQFLFHCNPNFAVRSFRMLSGVSVMYESDGDVFVQSLPSNNKNWRHGSLSCHRSGWFHHSWQWELSSSRLASLSWLHQMRWRDFRLALIMFVDDLSHCLYTLHSGSKSQ